jgi:N utilization substance protein B
MQVLFERERWPADDFAALERNMEELGEVDRPFAEILLMGVLEKEQELKDAVQERAPGWSLPRMDPISRCVLLVGAYELLFLKEAPPAVVMNEAIEIAKEYGTEESGKFVNGVLNAVAKGMRTGLGT